MDLKSLILKHSKPGPRYTSYPTAPQWNENTRVDDYRKHLAAISEDGLSLYVHIPFCEKLCYYCGCNIQISNDKGVAHPYVESVLKEIENVAGCLPERKTLNQIAWGGGTPTFLSVDDIVRLHSGVLKHFDVSKTAEVSIEIDPRVTTYEQLKTLKEIGFTRVSLGVQDFRPKVQEVVNRVQPKELTQEMVEDCRKLGFIDINIDLIYGLPYQTLESFQETVADLLEIGPDRIALYNYARLPSLLPHQKILEDHPMPSASDRVEIFTHAFERLTHSDYVPIGMDHFAKKDDQLAQALKKGALYRNFQGYSVQKGTHLIGLGASAIGQVGPGFFQNTKKASDYQKAISETGFATFRGMRLSEDDLIRQWTIQRLMCQFTVDYHEFENRFAHQFESYYKEELQQLGPLVDDEILEISSERVRVTEKGRLFVRNAAMHFDAYLKGPSRATYSKTV